MTKRIGLLAGAGVAALGIAGLLAPAAQAAAPGVNISFYTGGNATAGWLPRHSGFTATLPDASSYAVIELHHIGSAAPADQPTFTTDDYASGSPRWYIQFSGGDYLFGYPDGGGWETEGPVGYHQGLSWDDALAYVSGETVTAADVVMDASQPVPATDDITQLSYGGFSVGG